MTYYGKGGIQYDLSAQPLAAGGEGEIHNINRQPDLVAKIYKANKLSPEKEHKLIRMVAYPPNQNMLTQIAWPQDILYDSRRQFAGFVMPKMQINEDLNIIYEYGSSAKYPDMPWKNRIIIAENLCAVLHSIHNSGHVCGDLNPKNISVNPKTGFVVFLDTDSYHIQDGVNTYRCDVGIPEYLPVEIQRKMHGGSTLTTASLPTFSRDTDNFALAIHIFQLLMNGVHPFACAILPSHSSVTAPQPSDNIERGEFPFMQNMPGIKIPVYAPPITILPKTIQDLLKRAFIDGHGYPGARPKPVEWHTALDNLRQNLISCKKVAHHQYNKSLSSCPWCAVDKAFSQSLQSQSIVLTQTPKKSSVSIPRPKVIAPRGSRTSSSGTQNRKNWWQRTSISGRTAVITILLGIALLSVNQLSGWLNRNQSSNPATVTVSTVPIITINTHPTNRNVTVGTINGSLTIDASVTQNAGLSYQWHSNTANNNTGGTAINGATSASFPIPTDLAAGTYYYYCVVSASGGAISIRSSPATITVAAVPTTPVSVIIINTQPTGTTNMIAGTRIGALSVVASVL